MGGLVFLAVIVILIASVVASSVKLIPRPRRPSSNGSAAISAPRAGS